MLAGAFFGGVYGCLGLLLVDAAAVDLPSIGIAAVAGALVGILFGWWFGRRQPPACSLCTLLGFLLGLIPAALVLLRGAGLVLIGRPVTLAGLALVPAMVGLLFGGLFDRWMDSILFSEDSC